MKQQSVRKAAVFLMSLGPDVAGLVMSKLPEAMVEELTHNIASIGHVTYQEKRKVLSEFIAKSGQISGIAFGGEETAKQILLSLGMPTDPPPIARARGPDFDHAA